MNGLKKPTGAASSEATFHHQERDEDISEILVGSWVEFHGLASVRAQRLNGAIGDVVAVGERIGVYIHEEGKTLALHQTHLTVVDANCVSEPAWN